MESSTRFEKRGHEQETEEQKERARLTLTRSILDAICNHESTPWC